MIHLREIEILGERILELTTDPIPRCRILRDILRVPVEDSWVMAARAGMLKSKWVADLQNSQLADGTWGRFHSQDSSRKAKFPTTESAINRALALGMDKDTELLQKASAYMLDHLAGKITWLDPPEKHEGWAVSIRFITAATLAKIDPQQPAIQESCWQWVEIVRRTFRSGSYSVTDERQAHFDLFGIKTRDKFLKLAALYPLVLLSYAQQGLPGELEVIFLNWVWNKPGGIYYVGGERMANIPDPTARGFSGWVHGLEVLSWFRPWRSLEREALEWLWQQKDSQGLWDFGPNARASNYFPLSDNWRNPLDRKIDCSVRVRL